VNVLFGGGLAPEFCADSKAQEHFARLKALLDEVNVEDKGCVEKVYRGICSAMGGPGHLSHLERPNFEFAQYIASRIAPESAPQAAP